MNYAALPISEEGSPLSLHQRANSNERGIRRSADGLIRFLKTMEVQHCSSGCEWSIYNTTSRAGICKYIEEHTRSLYLLLDLLICVYNYSGSLPLHHTSSPGLNCLPSSSGSETFSSQSPTSSSVDDTHLFFYLALQREERGKQKFVYGFIYELYDDAR